MSRFFWVLTGMLACRLKQQLDASSGGIPHTETSSLGIVTCPKPSHLIDGEQRRGGHLVVSQVYQCKRQKTPLVDFGWKLEMFFSPGRKQFLPTKDQVPLRYNTLDKQTYLVT